MKLEARELEDMRVHLDWTSAGSDSRAHVKLTIPFDLNGDSAGGTRLLRTSSGITTTQAFFPLRHELEIPTESMGREWLLASVSWCWC